MYYISVYVPESHLTPVKEAVFAAGGGKIGNYDSCAWQTKGFGQFRPLAGSNPHIGEAGKIEQTEEWKIEFVCADTVLESVIDSIKKSHPYETPAYIVLKAADH